MWVPSVVSGVDAALDRFAAGSVVFEEPEFGRQAVFLDGGPIPRPDPAPFLEDLAARGVHIVAPPMPMLLTFRGGDIVASVSAAS